MKKFFSLFAVLAIAMTLSMPAFAKIHGKKHHSTTSSSTNGKKHTKHSKKKGATEGQKKGQ